MVTPEKIKKGLENCSASLACVNCPYDKRDYPHCVQRMSKDAAERIKQLETRLANMTEDFADFANAGIYNRAPFCENKTPVCVNSYGRCIDSLCDGFVPKVRDDMPEPPKEE